MENTYCGRGSLIAEEPIKHVKFENYSYIGTLGSANGVMIFILIFFLFIDAPNDRFIIWAIIGLEVFLFILLALAIKYIIIERNQMRIYDDGIILPYKNDVKIIPHDIDFFIRWEQVQRIGFSEIKMLNHWDCTVYLNNEMYVSFRGSWFKNDKDKAYKKLKEVQQLLGK